MSVRKRLQITEVRETLVIDIVRGVQRMDMCPAAACSWELLDVTRVRSLRGQLPRKKKGPPRSVRAVRQEL